MPHPTTPSADRQELDAQLSPSRSAKDAAGVMQAWGQESDKARRSPGIRTFLDVAYGPAANQKLDVYTGRAEEGGLRPVFAFIHGGFWQQGSKDSSAFPAPAFVAANWIYVAVGYTLAPNATLTAIMAEIRSALRFIHLHAREYGGDPDKIIVAGHQPAAISRRVYLPMPPAPSVPRPVPVSSQSAASSISRRSTLLT
jgi:arylformamidase